MEKLGSGVTSVKAGDRVFGLSTLEPIDNNQGGLQQYAVLNTNAVGKIPNSLLDEEVASLPTNATTSWYVLFSKDGFGIPSPFSSEAKSFDYAGTSIAIIGGGTNVGKFAVQYARTAGIGKIIVIAGTSNTDQLKTMGATHIIDRKDSPEQIAKQIQEITGSDGATYVYDCANMQFDLARAIVSPTKPSRVQTLLPIEGEEPGKFKTERALCDARFTHFVDETLWPETKDFWAHVPTWLEEGKVLPAEYRVVEGLEKVKEIDGALDQYREGARAGPQTVVRI